MEMGYYCTAALILTTRCFAWSDPVLASFVLARPSIDNLL
jgi:hypothetical protein